MVESSSRADAIVSCPPFSSDNCCRAMKSVDIDCFSNKDCRPSNPLVRESHCRGKRWFARFGDFAQTNTGKHLLEDTNVTNTQFPILETSFSKHVDGKCNDFSLNKRSCSPNQFNSILVEFSITSLLEFLSGNIDRSKRGAVVWFRFVIPLRPFA